MSFSRVGRNEPCPCGSGKKFKKCCGSPLRQRTQMPVQPTLSAQIPAGGVPGEAQGIVACNHFRDEADPRNIGSVPGLPGEYRVTFLFERPNYRQTKEYELSFLGPLRGDSHLAITKPAFTPPDPNADQIKVYATTPHGVFEFTGFPNEKGFLGKIVSNPFQATDRNDAERRAYDALVPALSNWSAHLDIPLEVQVIETMEMRTQNVGIRVVQPFLEAPFSVEGTPPPHDSEFAHYASTYREALNSNSSVYRFLCLFKIIEGIRVRRLRLGKEAAGDREKCVRPMERIPNDDASAKAWLNTIFPIHREWDGLTLHQMFPPEAKGKKLMHLVQTELTNLRDQIAHSIMRSGELSLSADDLVQIQRVNKWLPLTRSIARRMLKNDFPAQFLSYLGDDGTYRGGNKS
jgi:hypothetical protein